LFRQVEFTGDGGDRNFRAQFSPPALAGEKFRCQSAATVLQKQPNAFLN
jgi:hypothetical protein